MDSLHLSEITGLQAMPGRIADAARAFGRKYSAAMNKPRMTLQRGDQFISANEAMRSEFAQLRVEAAAALAALRGATDELRESAKAKLAAAMSRPAARDTSEALLRESRESRAWQRLKPILDRSTNPAETVTQLVSEALTAGDDDTVEALRIELKSYLEGRGNDELVHGVAKAFEAEMCRMRPLYAAAIGARAELERGLENLSQCFNFVETAIQQQHQTAMIVNYDGSMQNDVDITNGETVGPVPFGSFRG
jgi:hypothetical protein